VFWVLGSKANICSAGVDCYGKSQSTAKALTAAVGTTDAAPDLGRSGRSVVNWMVVRNLWLSRKKRTSEMQQEREERTTERKSRAE